MSCAILRARALSSFSCLGDKCEDTCCRGWSMQVDEHTLARYRNDAPELLEAVEPAEETPHIMRKHSDGFCVKLEGGLCGIHKKYGDGFLSDACHFYPRVTRVLGDLTVMTATMSCPEIARLALADDEAGALEEAQVDRLPHSLKDCLPQDLPPGEALAVHKAFLSAVRESQESAERIFLCIASASRSLERIARKDWPVMAPYYLAHAQTRLPPSETNVNDPFNLLHALCGLSVASRKPAPERLRRTIADMEKALAATLDWEKVMIYADNNSLSAYRQAQALWQREAAAMYAPLLRRWLQMQLSLALFPYAGLGGNTVERITIIGVRFATVKLALMCACAFRGSAPPPDTVIRIVQSLSRFLDHLGDPAFSLQIYNETGWDREARMRGLLE